MVWGDPFEPKHPGWFTTGGAGFDYDKGFAHRGRGNAWVRNTSGWNALNQFHPVKPHMAYTAYATLRLSPGLTDGYFSVREARELNGNGRIITEIKLVGLSEYRQQRLNFTTGTFDRVLFYIGLWGKGQDVWIQIDDFVIAEVTNPTPVDPPPTTPTCGVETRSDGFGQTATVRVFGQGFLANEEVQILRNDQYMTSARADSLGGYVAEYGQGTSLPVVKYSVQARGLQSKRASNRAGYEL